MAGVTPTTRASGQLHERAAEDILIAGRGALRGDAFARVGVETPRGVPRGLVVFGGEVAFAFGGHDVEELRAFDLAQCAQRAHQLGEVVAVDRPEIAEVEALEEVRVVQKPLLQTVPRLLAEVQHAGRMVERTPQRLLEAVVVFRGRQLQQAALQRPRRLVDRHVVVVEDHQQVGAARGSGVVEPLEGEASRHRTVADDGHHLAPLAPQLGGLRHAERRRDRDQGVVGAFGHARKAADAAQPALAAERLAAPRDDLVGVGLVADVPYDAVVGRVVDVVQRCGQLHGSEARGQMARVDRAFVDDVAAQFVAVTAQLLRPELFELLRRIDPFEQSVIFRRHSRAKIRISEGKCKLACSLPSESILDECQRYEKSRAKTARLLAVCRARVSWAQPKVRKVGRKCKIVRGSPGGSRFCRPELADGRRAEVRRMRSRATSVRSRKPERAGGEAARRGGAVGEESKIEPFVRGFPEKMPIFA